MEIVNDYVQYMRPLLTPQCEYLLLNRSGSQFQKLTELLSVLVFEAIDRQVHSPDEVQADYRNGEREQFRFGSTTIGIRRPKT